MTEELKPCPFCGSQLIKLVEHGNNTGIFTVCCGDCGVWSSRFLQKLHPLTKTEAVSAWNTRAEPAKQQPDPRKDCPWKCKADSQACLCAKPAAPAGDDVGAWRLAATLREFSKKFDTLEFIGHKAGLRYRLDPEQSDIIHIGISEIGALPDTTAVLRQVVEALDDMLDGLSGLNTSLGVPVPKCPVGLKAKEALAAAQAYLEGKAPPRQDVNREMLEVVRCMAKFSGRNNNSHLKEMARDALKAAEQQLAGGIPLTDINVGQNPPEQPVGLRDWREHQEGTFRPDDLTDPDAMPIEQWLGEVNKIPNESRVPFIHVKPSEAVGDKCLTLVVAKAIENGIGHASGLINSLMAARAAIPAAQAPLLQQLERDQAEITRLSDALEWIRDKAGKAGDATHYDIMEKAQEALKV